MCSLSFVKLKEGKKQRLHAGYTFLIRNLELIKNVYLKQHPLSLDSTFSRQIKCKFITCHGLQESVTGEELQGNKNLFVK